MNLGENIYKFRTQKNMSQGDLADALEVSRQSVSKWENNSAVPELEKLMKMAQLFSITLDELVTGESSEACPPTASPTPTYIPISESTPQITTSANESSPILGVFALGLGLFFLVLLSVFRLSLIGALVGIPLLLAGLFVILISSKPSYRSSQQQVAGIVLLIAGLAVFLVLSLVWDMLSGLVFASVLYVPGLICLFAKKHAGLKCAWAEFILLSAYFDYAAGINWTSFWSYLQVMLTHRDWAQHFNIISVILSAIQWALLAILVVWTVKCYSKRPEALQSQDMVRLRISAVCNVLMLAVNFGLMQLVNQNVLPIRLLSKLSYFLNLVRLGLFVWLAVELWPWIRKQIQKGKQ